MGGCTRGCRRLCEGGRSPAQACIRGYPGSMTCRGMGDVNLSASGPSASPTGHYVPHAPHELGDEGKGFGDAVVGVEGVGQDPSQGLGLEEVVVDRRGVVGQGCRPRTRPTWYKRCFGPSFAGLPDSATIVRAIRFADGCGSSPRTRFATISAARPANPWRSEGPTPRGG